MPWVARCRGRDRWAVRKFVQLATTQFEDWYHVLLSFIELTCPSQYAVCLWFAYRCTYCINVCLILCYFFTISIHLNCVVCSQVRMMLAVMITLSKCINKTNDTYISLITAKRLERLSWTTICMSAVSSPIGLSIL